MTVEIRHVDHNGAVTGSYQKDTRMHVIAARCRVLQRTGK